MDHFHPYSTSRFPQGIVGVAFNDPHGKSTPKISGPDSLWSKHHRVPGSLEKCPASKSFDLQGSGIAWTWPLSWLQRMTVTVTSQMVIDSACRLKGNKNSRIGLQQVTTCYKRVCQPLRPIIVSFNGPFQIRCQTTTIFGRWYTDIHTIQSARNAAHGDGSRDLRLKWWRIIRLQGC